MDIVKFFYADVKPVRVRSKKRIKEFIKTIFKDENMSLNNINYIFCSDEYILEINKSHLSHDYYTDIITFDLSEGQGIEAEVYISVDTVKSNALLHEVVFENEMLRVVFHGALHLCGYNDKTKSELTIMRQREDFYLRLYEKS